MITSGAEEVHQNKIYEFGRNIGLSFQIQDDYLDTFGDAQVGKKIGGDILNNKKTLLLISALQKGNTEQKAELNKWLNIIVAFLYAIISILMIVGDFGNEWMTYFVLYQFVELLVFGMIIWHAWFWPKTNY